MGKVLDSIDDDLAAWIEAQPVFFVATAPNDLEGHVNLSPKGYDTLRVLDPTTVAYIDLTGSGVETIAHLRENGRITLMLCAFEGPPRIVRMYGAGEVVLPDHPEWQGLVGRFAQRSGARAVIRVSVERLSSSCGFAVPFMSLVGERETLVQWSDRKSPEELDGYHAEKNAVSIDGLPGLA
jgi:predicted pyridoxine 5'-phosphate oxidase superfamily flavin-nucleotide-binding protein